MSEQLRPMASGDLAACAEIVDGLDFFQGWGLTGAEVQQLLSEALGASASDLRVATSGGEVVGFTWVIVRGAFDRSAYLRLIAVHEEARGTGVGRAMMAGLEADLLDTTDLTLLVSEGNSGAREFYGSLGYRQVGSLPDYVQPGVTECIYFKARRR
jgi:ribosomal protein S18 acetylase RimI-like enzyme